ncbi:MAG: alpha/beta fold hydrolase [Trueperaceae bacterium]|nr:alpha/beta fold hydrolase [Trueperaceae bacterium]
MTRPLHAEPQHEPRLRLLLGELAAPLEGLRLLPRLPRQVRSHDVPPRDVLVLPGWMVGDGSTAILRAALARDGHRVRGWGLGRNTGDVPARIRAVTELVGQRATAAGSQLDLVGWSLGGVIAREVARRRPDAVRRVVTLGTPLHGPSFTTFASLFVDEGARDRARAEAQRRARSFDGVARDEVAREQTERRRATPPPPVPVPVTVIWSRRDGIVQWRAQQDRDNPWAEHVEVGSTHLGMTLDPDVLDVLRDRVGADVTTSLRA